MLDPEYIGKNGYVSTLIPVLRCETGNRVTSG
jgi:hypothetical protein